MTIVPFKAAWSRVFYLTFGTVVHMVASETRVRRFKSLATLKSLIFIPKSFYATNCYAVKKTNQKAKNTHLNKNKCAIRKTSKGEKTF